MKRLLTSLGLVAALTLLPAEAASADILDLSAGVFPDDELAALSSSDRSFAVGGGTTATGRHFAFSARCKPATDSTELVERPADSGTASGYAVVSDPVLGEAQGHVCDYQSLAPRFGSFVIVVEKGSGFLGSFPNVVVSAQDLDFALAPDEFAVTGLVVGCEPSITGSEVQPVVRGNIVVKAR